MIDNRPTFPKGKIFLSSGSVDIVQFCSDGFEIYQLQDPIIKNLFGVVIHCETEIDADNISRQHQRWWMLLQTIIIRESGKIPFRDHFLFLASIQINENINYSESFEKKLLNQNQSMNLLESLIKLCKIARKDNFIPIIDKGSFILITVNETFTILPLFLANRFYQKHEYLCSNKIIVKTVYQFTTGIEIEGNLLESKNFTIVPAYKWNQEINENYSDFLISELKNKKSTDLSLETLERNFKEVLSDQNSNSKMSLASTYLKESNDSSLSPTYGLKKIAGMEKLKVLLFEEIIKPIQNPEPYKLYQISIPNGILLYGPPGCGKTFIAKQLAEELGYYFLEISPSEIASPFIHDSVLRIKGIFDDAEQHAPSIIFIDEFEAFVPSRSTLGGHQQFKSEEVNEFLYHLNESSKKRIIILAATNEPDKIDNAILRTGRFDKLIYVEPPDQEARKDLLKMYLKNRPQECINFDMIAHSLEGYSCSDVKNIVDESARAAMKLGVPINDSLILASIAKNPSSLSKDMVLKYDKIRQRGV